MNRFSTSLLTTGALILGLTTAALPARTSHVQYPNSTPAGAPRGTVEFHNLGNTTADIYIDNGYLGRIRPGDRVVVHNVWAGDTSVRWEYTYNYDGETETFYLGGHDRFVYTFYPYETCSTTPTYPTYPTCPTYGGTACGNSYVDTWSGIRIDGDDFHFGLGGNGFSLDLR